MGKHIEAKSPYDPPGQPGTPQVEAYSPSITTINRTPPTDTGGRPISGYLIEKRELGSEWNRVDHYPTPNLHYVIPGLREGARYEFRVLACTEAGPGQPSRPSIPSGSFELKAKANPPDPLRTPYATKVEKTYVNLKWPLTIFDGGSKVIEYIIEGRESGSSWCRLNDYNVTDPYFTATNLTTNSDYELQVFAVNAVGKSEPSLGSNLIKVQEIYDGCLPEFVRGLHNCNVGLSKRLYLETE